MNSLIQDLRYTFRAFVRSPGFTLAAVLSLAIGIGANTSIFSVTNALLLHPLPYKDAGRLVILWNRSPGLNITQDWFSTAQYFDIKNGQESFEQVAIAIGGNYNLTGSGEPERVGTVRVSSNLLPMLGARAEQGRLFVPEEDKAGAPATALLSYGMWVRHYGSDPQILGKSITINGRAYAVVGVTPQSFALPREVLPTLGGAEQAEILLPLPLAPDAAAVRDHEDYNIVGKLKTGVSLQRAQAEMDALTARLRRDHPEQYPPNGGLTFSIVPMLEQVVGNVRRALIVLLASVGCVLLIACANVANLLLSRAVARQKEIAVRQALGASHGRIVRQLLTESITLAICGGALGVLLAAWSVAWIRVLGPKSVPRLGDIHIDVVVLAFTLALSVLSGILFGLAPTWRISRLDLQGTLKDAGRGAAGSNAVWSRGGNSRKLLVVSELALSVVLLIGAGLLIRSFSRLQNVQPGFDAKNLLTFELTMTGKRYEDRQEVLNTYSQLWERLEKLPGVTAAGGTTSLPLSEMFAWGPITVEGRAPRPGEMFINADQRVVGGHYFQAMGIPLKRGRLFDEHDTLASPRVIVIDEFMAQELWPGEDAIGKRIHLIDVKTGDPWQTVVGVVGRVKQDTLESDPRIALYLAQTQFGSRAMNVVMKTGNYPGGLTAAVKKEIRDLDADLPIYNVRTMSQRVDDYLARRRFSMMMLGVFAILALVLGTLGIYSVMAYQVSQGTREIGIRMALGATQQAIVGLVVRQGMILALTGVVIGVAAAAAFTRLMQSLLFGITTTDLLTFTTIPVILLLTALAASYIPARRAARIDPMISLRSE
jgi:predicted permease